jgi:hypothetical protein
LQVLTVSPLPFGPRLSALRALSERLNRPNRRDGINHQAHILLTMRNIEDGKYLSNSL